MKAGVAFAALSFGVALTSSALAQSNTANHMMNAMTPHTITIKMGAQNGSKQDGKATFSDTRGGLHVTIELKNEPANASEPAHIHQGLCAKLNPAPWKALHNVIHGMSDTTLPGVTVGDLKKAHYAVNVHESAANLKRYVSCGDI